MQEEIWEFHTSRKEKKIEKGESNHSMVFDSAIKVVKKLYIII